MNPKCVKVVERLAIVLSSISNPTRILIVFLLCEKEMYVNQLQEELGTTLGNISQHLRILTDRELIESRKIGNKVFYSIRKDSKIKNLLSNLKSLYCPKFKV